MKLTIVLTVYNKEHYLYRAFDALLSQEGTSDEDYEVLVVNDGSTDGSALIINEFANGDKRVHVLTQNNQGLSMARNNGIDAARGEYIWFVDADDTISLQSVKLICGAMANLPDIIPIYARTEGIDKVRNAVSQEAATGRDIIRLGKWEVCGVFNVFRKSFLLEHNLRFFPGIYHEDAEFTPRVLYAAKSVKVVPEVLYTVFRDPDSITQVPRPKRAFDYLIVAERLIVYINRLNECDPRIKNALYYVVAQDINNALSIITKNNKEEQNHFNKVFFEKRQLLLFALKAAPLKKYKLEALLFKLIPKYYVGIYKMMRKFGRG